MQQQHAPQQRSFWQKLHIRLKDLPWMRISIAVLVIIVILIIGVINLQTSIILGILAVIIPLFQWLFPVPTNNDKIDTIPPKAPMVKPLSLQTMLPSSPLPDPQTVEHVSLKLTDEDVKKEIPRAIRPDRLPRPLNFVGRDDELSILMSQLRTGKTSCIYALNGMGGVGKTALAAEVVGRLSLDHEAFPGGAIWLFCEGLSGDDGIDKLLTQLESKMQLEQILLKTNSQARHMALINELAQFPRILIALDNVEPQLDAEELINTLSIPDHTVLLLTARQITAPEKVHSIKLFPLQEVDATTLFLNRLQQVDSNRPKKDERAQIPYIIAALGKLPLALELVASYAGVQQLSLVDIQRELEHDKIDATALNFNTKRALISRFDRSWKVLSPTEQRLFAALSLLQGSIFPRAAAIALAFTPARYNVSKQQAQQDIAKLVAFSLVETIEGQWLRLHPLIGEYAAMRFKRFSRDVIQNLRNAHDDFWISYGRAYGLPYPDYKELDGRKADTIWEAHEQLVKDTFAKFDVKHKTSRNLPTPKKQAEELRELGFHISKYGEVNRGRVRILESLHLSASLGDLVGMAKCYHYLALLDENTTYYTSAHTNYNKAYDLIKGIEPTIAKTVLIDLNRLETKMQNTSLTFWYKGCGEVGKVIS